MDVEVEKRVAAPPARVAAVMFDPARDPEWIGGARAVQTLSHDPHALGARVRRTGGFLGVRFAWVTELAEYIPDRLMRMTFVEGPMKGEVVYRIEPDGDGARVFVRNTGGSARFPGAAAMVRRSVAKDLDRLAALVEPLG
jgi:uncharacterized protein YndB with AHSA1/START domain